MTARVAHSAAQHSQISSLSSHSERVRDAIDVVEPGRDQRDLQDALVVEPGCPQPLMITFPDLSGVLGELHDVIEHNAFLICNRRRGVIPLKRFNQLLIQGHSTQKLCVGIDSINTPIGDRNHGSDHLVLPAAKWQFRRHEHAKGRERMVEGLGNQAV